MTDDELVAWRLNQIDSRLRDMGEQLDRADRTASKAAEANVQLTKQVERIENQVGTLRSLLVTSIVTACLNIIGGVLVAAATGVI